MAIIFLGNAQSQNKFRHALQESKTNCYIKSGEADISNLPHLCEQYDWIVVDARVYGGGKDAVPFSSPPQKVLELLNGQTLQDLGLSLQQEIGNCTVIGYHSPCKSHRSDTG